MTKSSCQEFLTCDFKPLAVPVLCFYGYDIRSCNLAEHSGYAKTAFAAGLFSAFFYYFRVYKFNFTVTDIYDNRTFQYPHLRSCKSDTVTALHCFIHIVKKYMKFFVKLHYSFAFLIKDFIAFFPYFSDCHYVSPL